MARFALPHVLADLPGRVGPDGAVRNTLVGLELEPEQRVVAAEDLIRLVEARTATARSAPRSAVAA